MTLFYLSLLASFVSTTIIAVVVYFGGRKSWSWLVIVPFALIVMTWSTSLAVAIHLPAALVAFWGYQQSKWGYAAFLGIVTTTLAGSYVIVCSVSYLEIESYRKRRESYAQELLAERLPPAQMSMGEKKLPEGSKRRLEITADKVGRVLNEDHRRTMALLNLHERRMEKFVNASGFGVRRIIAVPTEERVKPPDLAEPILQPGTRDELQWSDSNLAKESGHT